MSVRRFIVWIAYDGCRFPEMAKGGTGYSVLDFFSKIVGTDFSDINFSASSRTDAGVHAIRNAVVLRIFPDCDVELPMRNCLKKWNDLSHRAVPNGLHFLDIAPVSPGFCIRRSVVYRKYTYRLAVRRTPLNLNASGYSVACFSEKDYSWQLPPGISMERAESACDLFEGSHNMASFMKHTERDRRLETETPATMKEILRVRLSSGAEYSVPNEQFDYFNVTIVAKSFLREQIRRMISCIVLNGYGIIGLDTIRWLLHNPCSTHFYDRKIPIAPPQGLFLTDVIYDRNHFSNPVPYYQNSW